VAINVLRVINCIPNEAATTDPLDLPPAFVNHRLPETGLFRIPQLPTTHLFSVERADEPDSFRRRFVDLGLTGIEFVRVWSSETGAEDLGLLWGPYPPTA
jgi:hypothetical protein